MHDLLNDAVVAGLLAAAIRMLTPLLLAAAGELVAEKAGIMNLGVEGTMLTGCFIAFLVTFQSGSLTLGIAAAVLSGAVLGGLMAFATVTLRIEQFIMGLAINLLSSALTAYGFRALLKQVPAEQAVIEPLSTLRIPLLADLPLVGEALFSQTWMTYLAYLMVPAIAFLLYRTRIGLELRSLGENPKLLDTAGHSVAVRRYGAVIFGGAMAGLAGAALSAGSSMRFVEEMTAGRGWIVIVIVVAANWRIWRVPLVTAVFALLQAAQLQAQANGVAFPYEILLALPYVAAVGIMIAFRSSSRMPSALGVPYRRQ
ncbi:ABC transporter permease [Cupriavidus necator]